MNSSELKNKLSQSLDFLKGELSQIRTGRVSPAMFDVVRVNAYGVEMQIREVGTIHIVDPQTITITPWDRNLLNEIDKAIRNSQLQLNPVVKSDAVVVPVPALTEERRKEITRLVSVKIEECKNSIRNIRQDAMKSVESAFENKEFGEDEKFSRKEEIETIVKDYTTQAEELGEQKKKDIMTL
jgi:ribosome recycling factor